MYSIERLKTLLSDFIEGKISHEGAEELFDIINHQNIDEKLLAWLYSRWDESPNRSVGFHSEGIYQKIRNNLDLPAKVLQEEKEYVNYMVQKESFSNRKLILTLFKYAAVLIIAMVSSFLIMQHSGIGNQILQETYTEVRIQNGSKSTITLPDSTIVKLNSGSYLRYPDGFNNKNRQVYLEGEGFFSVKKGHHHPFYVKTGNEISIKVTGTSFNVKSYPEEQFIETTLISGTIIIEELKHGDRVSRNTVIKPNQLAIFNKYSKKLLVSDLALEDELIPIESIQFTSKKPTIGKNAQILTAWKDDKLVFYNEPLCKLQTRLERWYDIIITIEDEELKNYRYTGTFENESIEQALEALKIASSFEYQIDKNLITITK